MKGNIRVGLSVDENRAALSLVDVKETKRVQIDINESHGEAGLIFSNPKGGLGVMLFADGHGGTLSLHDKDGMSTFIKD